MFKEVELEPKLLSKDERKEQFVDINLIDHISKKLKIIEKELLNIKQMQQSKEYENILERNSKMIYLCEETIQLMRKIPDNLGIKNNNSKLNHYDNIKFSLEPEEVVLKIEDEDVIHIILKDLLPRRADDNKKHENRDYIRYKYTKAFHVFSKNNTIHYKDRVIVLIKNYFTSNEDMVDYDNIDSKIIMDCISTYFLKDDNPKTHIKVEDYGISKYRHSEIFIIPLIKWYDYLDLPFIC